MKANTITQEFKEMLKQGISSQLQEQIAAHYQAVVNKAAKRIQKRYGINYHDAEDIAITASLYTLPKLIKDNLEVTQDDWLHMTLWKANNLCISANRNEDSNPDILSLDGGYTNQDGETTISPFVIEASLAKPRELTEMEKDEIRAELCAVLRDKHQKKIERVKAMRDLARKTLKPHIAEIVISRGIDKMPMGRTCIQFDTTPNYVSVNVNRFNEIWKLSQAKTLLPSTNYRKFRDPIWHAGRRVIHKESPSSTAFSSKPEDIYGKDAWTAYISREKEIAELSKRLANEEIIRLRHENFELLKKNAKT